MTAQVLDSMCTRPSRSLLVPIFRPSAVMPRIYHAPSHSSRLQTSRTRAAMASYFAASSSRPAARAASTKWPMAQTCRKLTIALSPPPRLRQSFQSARSPLATPLIPVCRSVKSRMRVICS